MPDPAQSDTLTLTLPTDGLPMEIDKMPSALPPGGWDADHANDGDSDSLDRQTTLQLSPGAIDLALGCSAVLAVGASNQIHTVDNIQSSIRI